MLVPQTTTLYLLVKDSYLILNAVFFAFQRLLGDALDSHQSVRPLLLSQDHLWESSPETQTRRSASPTLNIYHQGTGRVPPDMHPIQEKQNLLYFVLKLACWCQTMFIFNHILLVNTPACWLKLWWACKLVGWFGTVRFKSLTHEMAINHLDVDLNSLHEAVRVWLYLGTFTQFQK